MSFKTAIVLFIFRRPLLAEKVFQKIRAVKPAKLFIVADGPSDKLEIDQCLKTREIIDQIDWSCDVSTDFSETNLGCRKRISSGLNWVFSQVEEAIILEDDCLPNESFFEFCQTLLEYYRYDQRVWVISGNNFQDRQWRGDGSYYFSRYNHCWGWATWKRAWKNYQDDLSLWPKLRKSNLLSTTLPDPTELEYWLEIFDKLYESNEPDSWAYRWTYTCWMNNALSILPNKNLVENIGFGRDSTHTKNIDSPLANLPTEEMGNIVHPSFIIRDEVADQHTFDHAFNGIELRKQKSLYNRAKKKLKSFLSENIFRLSEYEHQKYS